MRTGLLGDEPVLEPLHNLWHGRVFHFLEREAMRLERPVAPEVVGNVIGEPPGVIERNVREHVARADEVSFRKLEPEADHPRRSVEARRRRVALRDRHERAVVGATHEASDGVRERKWLSASPTAGIPL